MKTNKLLGIVVLAALGACGSDPAPILPLGVNPYGAGYGNCAAPQGVKDRTVYASFGGGSTIVLDIYRRGTQIEAIGEINVPSIASLYGGLYAQMPVGLPNQQFRSSLCTNGTLGTLEAVSAYEEIDLALRGNGVYVEMGQRVGGVNAYIVGEVIEGDIYIEFSAVNGMNAIPGQTFTSLRP